MFKNYLKIALRNIKRQKGYSFINITGLAIGMACTILILLWVQDELSFDRFHKNTNDIYRLVAEGNNVRYAISHAPFANILKQECPEIIKATRVDVGNDQSLIKYNEKKFEQKGRMVDPDFFEVFTYPFIKGDPKTVLSDPYSIVITEDLATKCFGDNNPLGKILDIDNQNDFTVTGVIENIPHNSHLQFDFLLSFKFGHELGLPLNWNDWSYYTYVLLQKNSSVEKVNQEINDCFKKHKPGEKSLAKYHLQPLTRIHLYSDFRFDVEGNSDIRYVYIFIITAILILIIACINFTNLSTARSERRAREVSVRKVIGSTRIHLVKQFFIESILFVLIAQIIALLLVELFIPGFNALSEKNLTIDYSDYRFILGSIAIIITTGIIAGSYPALLISSYNPVNALKGTRVGGSKRVNFRKILVVTQFTFSIGLIIGTFVVTNQLNFMRNAKLGFDKENLIYMELGEGSKKEFETLKTELLRNPNILNASISSYLPTTILDGTTGAEWEGKMEGEDIQMQVLAVDYNYLDTYKMQMVQGRFYSEEFSTAASEGILLNEAAIKAMGMESPIGKRFKYWGGDCKIIGVIKDFHYRPLHEEVEPLIMRIGHARYRYLTIRIELENSNFSELLRFLEKKWGKYRPNHPFEFHFLDETIENLYAAEQQMSKIIGYFAFLAIFVACLGLFGLTSYTIEQRTKEICIRKVLGASVSGMVVLLTKELSKWVFFANIFAWPIAWFTMNKWLQNFAYRTSIGIETFILSTFIALIIAIFSVSYQSIKAAIANPVEALRYE